MNHSLAIGMGWTEMLVILGVLLLLFGARKLPELARSMGSSVNEFKKGMSEGAKPDATSTPAPPASPSSHKDH